MPQKGPIESYLDRLRSIDRRRHVRPMAASELLDLAARIYQSSVSKAFGKTVLPIFYSYLSLVFIRTFFIPVLFPPTDYRTQHADWAFPAILLSIFFALPLFFSGIASSLCESIKVSVAAVMGENSTPDKKVSLARMTNSLFYSVTMGLLPTLIPFALIIAGVSIARLDPNSLLAQTAIFIGVILGGLSVFITPITLNRYVLVAPVTVFEGASFLDSLRRSYFLMKRQAGVESGFGHAFSAWTTIGILALLVWIGVWLGISTVGLTTIGTRFFGSSVWADIVNSAIGIIPGFFIMWVLVPLWGTIVTILYFDRRSRIEAYDIRLLAKDVMDADRTTVLL
ncbi:hypothetical protein QPK87_05365 [Kamptonema cortianum]|nr:hypothetical protein [Geitlerinema splendidum]MDK3156006.1 hypothetical protein [Kamptonema cortianum]